ncbi:MAG: hypothetical protein ACODAA_06890 [Gemmatimonadota bacterium]
MTFRILQTTAAAIVAPIIALYLHGLIGDLLAFLEFRSTDWRFVVTSFYGYLIIGFVCCGVAAKLAPRLGPSFYTLTLLGSVLAGVLLIVVSDYALLAEVSMATAVVIGALSYRLRMRGFSVSLHTRMSRSGVNRRSPSPGG